MKKNLFPVVLALCLATFLTSCKKSNEEKFLAEVESLVEAAEKVTTIEEAEDFVYFASDCNDKWRDVYKFDCEFDLFDSPEEFTEKSNLKMSQEQFDKYREFVRRLESALRKWEKMKESADDDNDDVSSFDVEDDISESDIVDEDVDEEEVSSSSGSEDWDALLDSYEKFVDKYISYMKKAAGGDLSAISEYTSLMEKAEEIGDKLDKAGDDLSSSQMNRYMKITEKMTKAAFE